MLPRRLLLLRLRLLLLLLLPSLWSPCLGWLPLPAAPLCQQQAQIALTVRSLRLRGPLPLLRCLAAAAAAARGGAAVPVAAAALAALLWLLLPPLTAAAALLLRSQCLLAQAQLALLQLLPRLGAGGRRCGSIHLLHLPVIGRHAAAGGSCERCHLPGKALRLLK